MRFNIVALVSGPLMLCLVSPTKMYAKWEFDVAEKLLTDNVEYERDMGKNIYRFTAKSAGTGEVIFNLMDKKSLWAFTDEVFVNID